MKQRLQILIVEDDPEHRNVLREEIEDDPDIKNCNPEFAESFEKVKEIWHKKFTSDPPDIVILDHFLSGSHDGTHVARWMLNKAPSLRIIVNTAYPFMETDDGVAYQGYIKLKEEGYYVNFLHKDSKSKTEGIPIWHGVLRPALIDAIDAIKTAKGEMSDSFRKLCSRLCAKSKPFMECLKSVERVMSTDINILFLGDNGTGKGKVAQEIHKGSKRKNGPFVDVNCAAIPEALFEAEFFGYKKGAFSGAVRDHKGFFLQAAGGTLFLDEVTEIPMHLQSKLLKAIQEKEIQRLGDEKKKDIDIRILSATNRDIADAVRNNAFREDLYYRLNKITIVIPPLRKRRDDIIPLAKLFINNFSQENNEFSDHALSSTAEKVLEKYHWPGNVRQLENIIEETLIKVGPERHQIAPTDIEFPKAHEPNPPHNLENNKYASTVEDSGIAKAPIERIEASKKKSDIELLLEFCKENKNKLVQVCKDIWEKREEVGKTNPLWDMNKERNYPDRIPDCFRKIEYEFYFISIRAVLAIVFLASENNKDVFPRKDFYTIFGFNPENSGWAFKQYLINKSTTKKSKKFFQFDPSLKGFGLRRLKADGQLLEKEEIILDIG